MNAHYHGSRPAPAETSLSIVLPVYNEAQVLGNLLDSILEAVAQCGTAYEVIFVNDGSRDESPHILDQLAAENPWVRVIHLSRNFGHQAAVQAGLAHARGNAIVLMDSDMQDAPTALPQFVQQWQAGNDVVLCHPRRPQGKPAEANRLCRFLPPAIGRLDHQDATRCGQLRTHRSASCPPNRLAL